MHSIQVRQPVEIERSEGLARRGAGTGRKAGLLHDPFAQLPLRIGQTAERTQGHEGPPDVFDARFNDTLVLRVVWRTGINPEAVSLSKACIGTLDLGVVRAGLGDDRALHAVNDDPSVAAAEPLEGATGAEVDLRGIGWREFQNRRHGDPAFGSRMHGEAAARFVSGVDPPNLPKIRLLLSGQALHLPSCRLIPGNLTTPAILSGYSLSGVAVTG
jgi:hypothetical protein